MAMDRDKYEETKRLILSGQTASSDFSEEQTAINTQILIDNLKSGTIVEPELFFDSGISMDHRDPEIGGTLLHVAAAYGVRSIVHLILKQGGTNYLMQDFKGRYPSELAYEVARDFVLGRFLMKKEIQQAGNRIIYGPDAGKIVIR